MLKGKKVLVTGSSRGIGAEIARAALRNGAEVMLHGRAPSAHLELLAKELKVKYCCFDVADPVAVARLAAYELDVVVNNAGINPSKTFEELRAGDWHEIFATNFFGAVNVIHSVLPRMRLQGGGSIVNVASVKGLNSVSGKPAYAASKAALIRLTTSLAEEFAPYGIRVNAVAPGFIESEMTEATLSPKIRSQIGRIPFGRMGTPHHVADAVVFLASDRAEYITGQCLAVDGGLSIV